MSTTESTTEAGATESTTEAGVYYDPFDFEIDADPYPTWKRLREEAPLYCNEKYGFFALQPIRRPC